DLVKRPGALDEPAIGRDPEIDLHEVARVAAGLRDDGLRALGDEWLVLVAADDQVDRGLVAELAIRVHVLMRDGDDELRAALAQRVRRVHADAQRIVEDHVAAARGALRGLGEREAEQADADAAEHDDAVGLRAAERAAGAW